MKTCTKCNQSLPETDFAKHSQKPCGLNPSCKKCERETKRRSLEARPMCIRCKNAPHMKGDTYCYPCSRIIKGKGPPSHIKRKTGLEWCKVCGINPRLSYHHYCFQCKKDYQNRTRAKKWSLRYSGNEQKRIETARAYATGLLQRGKIKRGPCVFCGVPGQEFHHYDYERKTRNFDDVCKLCHVFAHSFLNIMLTVHRMRV